MGSALPSRQAFTIGDFRELGRRYGFVYHLPRTARRLQGDDDLCVAEGCLQEFSVRQGMTLVTSDVQVHHHYESTSTLTPRFSAIVMLEGSAELGIGQGPALDVRSGSGALAAYDDVTPMTGHHRAGDRLRSVNLSLTAPGAAGDDVLGERLDQQMRSGPRPPRPWRLPPHLLGAARSLFDNQWEPSLQALLREGVCLQLLSHALADEAQPATANRAVSARDRRLLARVIERLETEPRAAHRLADLAALACMSPSALRAKFQLAHGVSIFGWLRARRLDLARDLLEGGGSIQDAAHLAGYGHAGNFATAFRRRHGVAPSALTGSGRLIQPRGSAT